MSGTVEVKRAITRANTVFSPRLLQGEMSGTVEVKRAITRMNTVCSPLLWQGEMSGTVEVKRAITRTRNTVCSALSLQGSRVANLTNSLSLYRTGTLQPLRIFGTASTNRMNHFCPLLMVCIIS